MVAPTYGLLGFTLVRRDKPVLQWPPLQRRSVFVRAVYGVRRFARSAGKYLLLAVIVGWVGYYWYSNRGSLPSISDIITPQFPEEVVPGNPLWDRPPTAPNRSPWPTKSNYVAGYPRLNVSGIADVVADNSGGANDLFVKLIDRDQSPMKAVRVFFLRAKGQLTLARVKPGLYNLRYMNLDTGLIRRCPPFEVTLKKTPKGEEYEGWTVPVYDVIDGTEYHDVITQRDF